MGIQLKRDILQFVGHTLCNTMPKQDHRTLVSLLTAQAPLYESNFDDGLFSVLCALFSLCQEAQELIN